MIAYMPLIVCNLDYPRMPQIVLSGLASQQHYNFSLHACCSGGNRTATWVLNPVAHSALAGEMHTHAPLDTGKCTGEAVHSIQATAQD
jgi:hypothetical protein